MKQQLSSLAESESESKTQSVWREALAVAGERTKTGDDETRSKSGHKDSNSLIESDRGYSTTGRND